MDKVQTLANILTAVNAALFTLLALSSLRQWRERPSQATSWLAITFVSLSTLTMLGIVFDAPEDIPAWMSHIQLVLLVIFPWALYRFTNAFGAPRIGWLRIFDALTAAVLALTLIAPVDAAMQDPVPDWYPLYVAVILGQWTLLLGAASTRLLRAGRCQPTIVRRRMLLLAIGALGMASAIVLLGTTAEASLDKAVLIGVISQLLASFSALSFYMGVLTPKTLRILWRAPEQEAIRSGLSDMLLAPSVEQLQSEMMPLMAKLVAARGIAMLDYDGNVIALHGVTREDALEAQSHFPDAEHRAQKRELLARGLPGQANPVLPMDFPFGIMLVWIDPYMPFFGREEFELTRNLGGIFALVLQTQKDLAEQTERAEQMAQLSKLKDEFVAMASHELRTPLTSIMGFSQTLRDMPERLSETQRLEFMNIIHDQAGRLQKLVEDMLMLSRIESGRLRVEPEAVDIAGAMYKAKMALSSSAAKVDCPEGIMVHADPHHLHQILVNYLTNAERYGGEPYRMCAEVEGDNVRIVVEDCGEGVPAEFESRLFDRFAQAVYSGQQGTGTGLGLAIVREMARAQRGDAWYEPRPGGGSRFGVTLPLSAVDSADDSEEPASLLAQ